MHPPCACWPERQTVPSFTSGRAENSGRTKTEAYCPQPVESYASNGQASPPGAMKQPEGTPANGYSLLRGVHQSFESVSDTTSNLSVGPGPTIILSLPKADYLGPRRRFLAATG